ncbi:MAG: molybdate transporter, inner rane subunit [Gemmataceae bacterium]|nr:molybdate transporter, inner rane subunit [Gemmataceae bacterium]
MDWAAAKVTLWLAVGTTGLLLATGLPLAYWLATTRRRWKVVVEAVVTLPLILPPTVLGFYLLLASGPHSPLGRAIETAAGRTLPFTFAGILIGSVLVNLPFAVRPFAAAFSAVDRRYAEAAWCLGVSRLGTFARVTLPLAWPGIFAGVVLTFAHTVGEFGVVLMVGGNVPGVTRTLSVAVYDDVQALDYDSAATTAAGLVAFAFVAVALTHFVQRRGGRP